MPWVTVPPPSPPAASLRAARATRLPTLSAEVATFYIDNVPTLDISLPTGQTFSRPVGVHENYQMDWRLTVPLFTGGRIRGIDVVSDAVGIFFALPR